MFSPIDNSIKEVQDIDMQNGVREVSPYKVMENLPSNQVSTSKYTLFTFIPLNLIEQFSKPPNIYFFMIGLLQMIPSISSTQGVPTMYIPLGIISFISAMKDLYQDRQRSVSDKIENNRQYIKYQESGQTSSILSKHIKVGMVVKVCKSQIIPCDGLILSISQQNKYAFISTSNLDGQMHLKRRSIHRSLTKKMAEQKKQNAENYFVACQKPNPDFHQFQGFIHFDNKRQSVNQNNICLRGTKLKNTDYIILLVLYTGKQTKVLLNMSSPHAKTSTLQKQVRILTLMVFLFIIILSFLFALLYQRHYQKTQVGLLRSPLKSIIIGFFSWILNLTNLIPISLLITLQSVCLIQGKIIVNDSKMFANNFKPLVNTSSIVQQLGAIQYVASDKTGTLTKNQLKVKKLSDGDIISNYEDNVNFNLLQLFCICHNGYVSQGQFQSVSQDEVAILEYCKDKGLILKDRTQMTMELYNTQYQTSICLSIIHNIQFSSERKRQSLVYQKEGKIYLVTKGSDDVIVNLSINSQNKYLILNDVLEFAKQGLRTMVIAKREIDRQYFQGWFEKIITAKNNLDKQTIKQLEIDIEKNLQIVGVVGIEDQLQDDAIEVVKAIVDAGIQFMIISGDRPQTVLSIAKNLKLKQDPYLCHTNEYLPEYQNKKFLVFARCTPKNKRNIVIAISGNVLAIGDGANDVSMLTSATFGVGIAGKEGRAAAQSSDIAVGQFKHLKKLLFVYGRQTYRKNSYLLIYSFYKNILFTLPQIIFGFKSYYTGVAIYQRYLAQFYNTIFTSATIFFYALLDKSQQQSDLLQNKHKFYQDSKSQSYFSLKTISLTILQSIVLGIVSSLLSFTLSGQLFVSPNDLSLYEVSSIVMLYVVIFVNFRIVSIQTHISLTVFVIAIAGILSYILFFELMIQFDAMQSESVRIFFNRITLLLIIVVLAVSALISYIFSFMQQFKWNKKQQQQSTTQSRLRLNDVEPTMDTAVELMES